MGKTKGVYLTPGGGTRTFICEDCGCQYEGNARNIGMQIRLHVKIHHSSRKIDTVCMTREVDLGSKKILLETVNNFTTSNLL